MCVHPGYKGIRLAFTSHKVHVMSNPIKDKVNYRSRGGNIGFGALITKGRLFVKTALNGELERTERSAYWKEGANSNHCGSYSTFFS